MEFFLPAANDKDGAEKNYAELAIWAGCTVPADGQRIQCIRFIHDGDDWAAEVGKPLSGMRIETKRRKAGKVTIKTPRSDLAIVLAIFPGNPYMVVTHARPITDRYSAWCNPFMAGRPYSVLYFDAAAPNPPTAADC